MIKASAYWKLGLLIVFFSIAAPNIEAQAVSTQIHFAGFESGEQGWSDPGTDSNRQAEGGSNNPPPSQCDDSGDCGVVGAWMWHIQDDSTTSHTEQSFDFTGNESVNLTFWSREWNWNSGEYVRVLCDATEVWRLNEGDTTPNIWHSFSIHLFPANCTFDSTVTIRFDGAPGLSGNGDDWFIDGINITGMATAVDSTAPTYANITVSPANASAYSSMQTYAFNVTFLDNTGIDDVVLTFNNTNHSLADGVISSYSDVYSFNVTSLSAATYNYQWHANDTSGNSNQTSVRSYTVLPAASLLNLTLDGNNTNLTVAVNTLVNLTAEILQGEGAMQLYREGELINKGTVLLSNLTNFTTLGTFNITANYLATENHTSNHSAHYVTAVDITPPTFENNIVTPANNSAYSLTTLYVVNLTITDDIAIDEVILTFNNTNYTLSTGGISNYSDTYSFNITGLAASTYTYQWYANDTSGNSNQTGIESYTVAKAIGGINLTLDGSQNNIAVTVNTMVNITAQKELGEGVIQLLQEGALINEGSTFLNNLTNFTNIGTFNITALYPMTENYTSNFTSFFVTSMDNVTPLVILVDPLNNNVSITGNVTFKANASENIQLLNATLYHNLTGTWKANASLAVSGIFNATSFTLNNIQDAFFAWNVLYCDNSSNCAFAPQNFTVNVSLPVIVPDTEAPNFSNIKTHPPNASNYLPTQLYLFNVTWTDNIAVDTITITFNNTNSSTTLNEITNLSDTYTFNTTGLAASTYTYQWHANDTSGNGNQTSIQSYTVLKAASSVDVTLNGSASNLSVIVNTVVNITAQRLQGEGEIQLFKNGSLINQGSLLISNLTNFTSVGSFNITALYASTENYTSDDNTFYVNVTSASVDAPPTYANLSVSPPNASSYLAGQAYIFNITLNDDNALDEVIITFNNTNHSLSAEEISNYSDVYTFNRTGLAAATYAYQWHFNDTGGKSNQTGIESYTVLKEASALTLTLDGQASNLTVVVGDQVNITTIMTMGEGNLQLFQNDSLFNEGGSTLSNATAYPNVGTFNITALSLETENYTRGYSTHHIMSVDNVTPTSNALSDANYTVNATGTIDWVLVDNYAPGHYYVERNGSVVNWSAWTNNSNLAVVVNTSVEGIWNYTLSFNDSFGNAGVPDTVLINVSMNVTPNVAPTIALNQPLNETNFTVANVLLNVTVDDSNNETLTVFFYGDGAFINETTAVAHGSSVTHNWTGLTDGSHSWMANVSDGKINVSSLTRVFVVDTTAPTSNAPSDASYTVNVTGSIEWVLLDNYAQGSYYVERNGTKVNASSWLNNTNVSIGINTVVVGLWNYTIFYNDSLGTTGVPDTVFINITANATGNTAPNITLQQPVNNTKFTVTNVALNVSVTDPEGDSLTVYFYGDGALINTTTGVSSGAEIIYTWTGLADGSHSWSANVSDGEYNTSSASLNFIVDSSVPTSNSPGDASYVVNSTQTIDWVLADNYAPGHYYVELNGSIVNASAWMNNTNLGISANTSTLGVWNYTLSFNDSLGNDGSADTVLITITENASNVQPTVTLSSPVNNSFIATTSAILQATVYDEDSDDLTVWFYGDGVLINTTLNQTNGSLVSYLWPSLSESVHNWTVIVNDGLVNSTNEHFIFTVDTIAPTVVIVHPQNGTNYTSDINIPLNYSSSDTSLDKTWYNLDGSTNITLTQNITFNTTEGIHTLYLYANDTVNNVQSAFTVFNVSLPNNGSSGSSSGSNSGSGGGGSNNNVGSSTRSQRNNPGAQAPRPNLPSSPTPGTSSSPGATPPLSPPKIVPSVPAITGGAVGTTVSFAKNNMGKFLLGLAVLAGVLSLVLRKRQKTKQYTPPKEERPMQFTVKKEPSFLTQKVQQTIKSVVTGARHAKEARREKTHPLNMRRAQQKMMVKEPDKLRKLEGLIGEEFLQQIRNKEEQPKKLTKQDFKQHFPLTTQELKDKGIKPGALREGSRPNVQRASKHIRQKQATTSYPELRRLFPETLGKAKKLPEKRVVLQRTKPSVVEEPAPHRDPTRETFSFRKLEKEPVRERKSKLQTNRKINKKTNKRHVLKGLQEVYDIE